MDNVYGYDGKVLHSCFFLFTIQGNIYPFFFLVMLLLIFIPATIAFVRHHFRNVINSITTNCICKPCTKKAQKLKRRRRQSYLKPMFFMHMILLCGGWGTIFQMSTTILSSPQVQIWDPFRLLDVSVFSSAACIKRQYKRKSLKSHPDKRSKDVTKEESEAIFIDITKAYKAYLVPWLH